MYRAGAWELRFEADVAARPLSRPDLSALQGAQRALQANRGKLFANPCVAAGRGFIDEVIMPHSTRRRICRALRFLRTKKLENPWKKHDNIPL